MHCTGRIEDDQLNCDGSEADLQFHSCTLLIKNLISPSYEEVVQSTWRCVSVVLDVSVYFVSVGSSDSVPVGRQRAVLFGRERGSFPGAN